MSINKGFVNENEFIEYFNGKSFVELNENFKDFVLFITDDDTLNEKFLCKKGKGGQKPDVILTVGNKKYFISLKVGSGNSVHQEMFSEFLLFLDSIGFSKKGLDFLKEFHYADGTLNDTGRERLSSVEFCKKFPEKVYLLNKELNKKEFKQSILNRVLFQGKSESYDKAEFIYHGTIEKGYWAKSTEIINFDAKIKNNCVHVGNLTYQPWGRNQNFNAVHPERRYVSQFKFGGCEQILKQIREKSNDKSWDERM